jgi:uncharacterized membrane protein (DUF485 family)
VAQDWGGEEPKRRRLGHFREGPQMAASVETIMNNPKYQELVSTRKSLGWSLTALTLVIYFGFILLIAFDPALLAMKLGDGVMTLGMPVGLAVIVSTFVIVGFYVIRANAAYDTLTQQVVEESK